MMFIDLPDGCWYGDWNTWNTIPVSGQKITLSKQTIKRWIIKQSEIEKREQKQMKVEQLMNNNRNWHWIRINTDSLNIQNWRLNRDYPMFARIKYLCDYRTDNCNFICLHFCCEASDDMLSVLCFYQACGLWTPKQLCCLTPNAPVQYQSSSRIEMIVSWE
jgi:hypothetical protein